VLAGERVEMDVAGDMKQTARHGGRRGQQEWAGIEPKQAAARQEYGINTVENNNSSRVETR
jgi:hypothetical protein